MNETPWARLHRLAYARIDHLGIAQTELQSKHGGPSPSWLRKLKNVEGAPSTRHTASLLALSNALGWSPGMARGIVVEDRSTWTPEQLEQEEHDLVYGDDLTGVEVEIRDFQTLVAARLRDMPATERTAAMKKISKVLGVG